MKVFMYCPGSFSHGIESPVWGEGRWSYNAARMLARAGHEVFCSSGGDPTWGPVTPWPEKNPIKLIGEYDAKKYEPYDIYVDTCWWADKPVLAESKWYIRLHWELLDHLKEKLPSNHIIAYPYRDWKPALVREDNPNKTIFLPTEYGYKFADPEPSFYKKNLLWPTRDAFGKTKDHEPEATPSAKSVINILKEYRAKNPDIDLHCFFSYQLKPRPEWEEIKNVGTVFTDHIAYDITRQIIRTCKLSLPINQPSCIYDCTAEGVASLNWEVGGFFTQIAKSFDVLIPQGASQEYIKEVFNKLMTDKNLYINYVKAMQDHLQDHTHVGSLTAWLKGFDEAGIDWYNP